MHILVELEGVLRAPDDGLIPVGVLMVGTLTVYNQVTFITDLDKEQAERWLLVNKIVDFDNIIDSSVKLEDEDLRTRQITVARAKGAVDLFITGNPALWAFAFDQGIAAVMFGMPSYLRPEFRPDLPKKIRTWNQIEEAIEKQNVVRTQDARLSRTESLNFE
jgi:hypothetical protein